MIPRLELRAPKPGTRFFAHRGRLALFHPANDQREYWRHYWFNNDGAKRLRTAASGTLDASFGACFDLLRRYVPTGARVLEAGCGPGHVVACANARGYRATGIDFVPEVIRFATSVLPDLDVRVGDVEQLPFPDASFDCYASLGVIEHFEAGPERAIAEASRVLKSGGIAIVEVPFLNPLRKELLRRLSPEADRGPLRFHQYYYSETELASAFERGGFTPVERVPNCWDSVLFREHPVLAPLLQSRVAIGRIRTAVRRVAGVMPRAAKLRYAHTIAVAYRRK